MNETRGAGHTESDDTTKEGNEVNVLAGIRVGVVVVQSLCDDAKFVLDHDIAQTKDVAEGSKDNLEHSVIGRQMMGMVGGSIMVACRPRVAQY